MITTLDSYGRFPPGMKEYVQAGIQGQLPINAGLGDRDTSSWATGGLTFHSGIGGGGANTPFNNPLTPTSALTNTTNLKFSAPKGITSVCSQL